MINKKIQLQIKSIDKTTFKLYLIFLKKILKELNIKNSIFCLPKKKKRLSLLKSPHVNKKAIEQFEITFFTAVLTIKKNCFNIENNTYFLKNLIINKPKSINLKMKRMV